MYLRKVTIGNVRSIKHFEMTFPEGKEAGWHVLIGDNGVGEDDGITSGCNNITSRST
jgi:predicted ATP-dependent endonuclease of OLD family